MLNERELINLDFNLLMLLKILGEERNSRKAAERMFVTQSAISKGLKKLRLQFKDDLFIRNKKGMVPTEYCEKLLIGLPAIIESISGLLVDQYEDFRVSYDGLISLAICAPFLSPFTTEIIKHFQDIAPNATLKIVNWDQHTEVNLLNKNIQVGLNYYPLSISKEIIQKPLCDVNFKLCVCKSHPLAKSTITLEDAVKYPLVITLIADYTNSESYIERIFADAGYKAKIAFQSDQVTLCYKKLALCDGIMPIHSSAELELPDELTLVDFSPSNLALGHKIGLYYSATSEKSRVTSWIADELKKVIQGI